MKEAWSVLQITLLVCSCEESCHLGSLQKPGITSCRKSARLCKHNPEQIPAIPEAVVGVWDGHS